MTELVFLCKLLKSEQVTYKFDDKIYSQEKYTTFSTFRKRKFKTFENVASIPDWRQYLTGKRHQTGSTERFFDKIIKLEIFTLEFENGSKFYLLDKNKVIEILNENKSFIEIKEGMHDYLGDIYDETFLPF